MHLTAVFYAEQSAALWWTPLGDLRLRLTQFGSIFATSGTATRVPDNHAVRTQSHRSLFARADRLCLARYIYGADETADMAGYLE